eukprot:13612168-Alexandrium_andersonii.AAC.1
MAAAAHQARVVGSPPFTGTKAIAQTSPPGATGARAAASAAKEDPSASSAATRHWYSSLASPPSAWRKLAQRSRPARSAGKMVTA